MTSAAEPRTQTAERAERVELILAQLDDLPTLPTVAVRVLELTTASDSNARQVIRLIESDQSLTAKILALTRRASTGVRSEVATVEKAVVLLGFEAVRNAVLSIKVFETFARREGSVPSAFDRTEFWKHSLAVACAAQLAAEQLSLRVDPEHAFVCGLLHDIGKVALDACLPKSYDRVIRRTNAARACIANVERELLGIDHTVVGHRLARRWHLPASLAECIWLHQHSPSALPASVQHPDAVKLVHFADRLARELRIGYSGNFYPDTAASALATEIGLGRAQYDRVVADLASRIAERAHLIGLDRLSSHDVYIRALSDANEELSRANASLAAANQRLNVRSRYFAALNEMNRRMVSAVSLGDVCAAAAEAMRTALEVPAAAVFFFSSSTQLLHAGFAGGQDSSRPRCVAWDGTLFPPPEGWAAGTVDGSASFLPCSVAAPALAERVQAETGTLLPWLCPVVQDGVCRAGALLAGEAESASRWAAEAEELGALIGAVRLWLTNVEAQQTAQRLNEDLSEINRRLQQAHRDAARARSLAMVAEMAAGAAHELNNPLAVISGRAQMLRSAPPDEATARVAAVLAEQAQRCSQIVAELMEFARPKEPEKRPVALGAFLDRLRDTWLDRTSLLPDQFVLELSDELPTIRVDVEQITSAFDELIRNATEAMEGRTPHLVVNCQWDPTDERVVIRIEDNGRGMDPHTLERAVDPFFSHRPAGRGRGLGLSRAVRWIEINGGSLRLDSREGEGTTVFVEFAASDGTAGR